MVSVDNKAFLINHIRKCFLTGDDTGFCETLLGDQDDMCEAGLKDIIGGNGCAPIVDTEGEDFSKYSPEVPYVEDSFLSASNKLPSDNDLEINRVNRNKHSGEVRTLTESEIEQYFPVAPITPRTSASPNLQKSSLTLALEQAQADGRLKRSNLFADYSIHDGRSAGPAQPVDSRLFGSNVDPSLRQFVVWFWRVTDFPRTFLCVQPRPGTTVQQFVGLTFWQYFNDSNPSDQTVGPWNNLDRFDASFIGRISVFMLDTSEEDVDSDFPPLEPTDPIHKYGFDSLALVERPDTAISENENKEVPLVLVFIHMPQGISTFRFPADTQLSAVLDRAVRRRHLRQHGGYEYHLESWPSSSNEQQQQRQQQQSDSQQAELSARQAPSEGWNNSSNLRQGQHLELTLRLSDVVAAGLPLRFVLMRDNSRCDPFMVDTADDDDLNDGLHPAVQIPSASVHATLQLRQYRVTLLKGLFPREVQLNVSADGIKVEQVPISRRPKLFSKPGKLIVYGVDSLADCELISSGSTSTRSSTSEGTTSGATSSQRLGSSNAEAATESQPSALATGKTQFRIVYLAQASSSNSVGDSTQTTTSAATVPQSKEDAVLVDPGRSSHTFQQLCFETQWARARAICAQLNLILECSQSRARQLYMQRRLVSEKS
ncbi:unnamed protein product [Calicophoron daubneyi]|uniref:CRIM domain-containing protein n=1 Tax=Calicophoron daubneyi TaxID=300641 RepID=A0AAV2TUP3_CALDB